MKNSYTICNNDSKIILENETIEEIKQKELEEFNNVFRVSVDKMTDKQRRIADMYIEKELKKVDDYINQYLNN